MRYLVLTTIFLGLFSGSVEAKQRAICDNLDVMRPCAYQPNFMAGVRSIKVSMKREKAVPRKRHVARVRSESVRVAVPRSSGTSLAGVVPALAAKVGEIVSACGSQVVSAIRHTYIAGTRHISQHANGTAVDIAGNPTCIYSMLHGWPGGYSVDYARMRHVHLSIGGPEAGLRFRHGGGRRYAHRHRHHRYAAR